MARQQAHHEAFRLIREQKIQSLNIHVHEFEHKKTAAQHIHLQSPNKENVFLVALRTVPTDSTGVAHILEHTALCGSEKYPVRDPFFMMTRRSLNTFMNAFTSSDWTAYPFASMNKKDFNNLLDVYLDAVFFSRLDELDFAQEGHRLEFAEIENPESKLEFKGVVYNEMKGAMSSVPSQLWHTMSKYLFPTTTYHYNSGGEPEHIPDLSYKQLQHFYQTHYHPSNAIFMTFGDIPVIEHQTKFEQQVLKRFNKLDYQVSVPDEKRYQAPIRVEESYPLKEDNLDKKSHVVKAWLLGKSSHLEDYLKAQLLSSILLDNSATPLMHALETTELGDSPSPLCGLDDSQKELTFMCGLAGCKKEDSLNIDTLIQETLTDVIKNGITQADVESALHQLELHQREIGGDHYPYGLQLILTSLTSATHRGDPCQLLDITEELEKLRQAIKSPDFIPDLVKSLLVDNQHQVLLTLSPDAELGDRKESAEKKQLAKIKAELSHKQAEHIVAQSVALKARQEQVDDEGILPKVTLQDVPRSEDYISGTQSIKNDFKVTHYDAGTNGIVYQQLIFNIPELNNTQKQMLSLYSSIVTELGVGDQSYLDIQKHQASICGSFSAFSSIRPLIDDCNSTSSYFVYSGKALNRNQTSLSNLMYDTINNVRFDEHPRIREIVAQIHSSNEQRLTGNGHVLAMTAACANICGSASLTHSLNGLAGYSWYKALNSAFSSKEIDETFYSTLENLHQAITRSQRQALIISENEEQTDFIDSLYKIFSGSNEQNSGLTLTRETSPIQQAWLTQSQVNFCAKAYPTVTMAHTDSAPLVVLGALLRNGFLHTEIRERGGAYGGGASQDNNIGAFRFYSYRDPRLEATLNDFDRSIQWVLSTSHSPQKLEEAILGSVSNLDTSESPAGRAKRCFYADLHGRNLEAKQRYRHRLLDVTIDDIRRVAEKYLTPSNANTAIITDVSRQKLAEELNLTVKEM